MSKYRGATQHRKVHPKIFVWSHTEKAEIEYFQDYKNYLRTPLLMPQKNISWTPIELLEQVIKWKNKNINKDDGDQVWCIFDVDDFYKDDKNKFINIIKKAVKNNVKIAYANECFELWILLHFQVVTSPLSRGREIEDKIKQKFIVHNLGEFKKNQKVFDILLPFQNNAIKNSLKSIKDYKKINWNEKLSEKGNPSTTIHFLISEIKSTIEDTEN